ncbi:MAG: hypothetical protein ABI832_06045 [bacterium]
MLKPTDTMVDVAAVLTAICPKSVMVLTKLTPDLRRRPAGQSATGPAQKR